MARVCAGFLGRHHILILSYLENYRQMIIFWIKSEDVSWFERTAHNGAAEDCTCGRVDRIRQYFVSMCRKYGAVVAAKGCHIRH